MVDAVLQQEIEPVEVADQEYVDEECDNNLVQVEEVSENGTKYHM